MKFVTIALLGTTSLVVSRLLLLLVNPHDPEGTNLLVVIGMAAIVFVVLSSLFKLTTKKNRH